MRRLLFIGRKFECRLDSGRRSAYFTPLAMAGGGPRESTDYDHSAESPSGFDISVKLYGSMFAHRLRMISK
jgi:hypothetical protein